MLEEEIELKEEALEELVKIGTETSLRHAVQLLEPSRIIAERKERKEVTKEDVREALRLFMDVKQSVAHVKKYEESFLR
jgi:DNA helicase TIP49 (TBP-interacting protein)